MMIEFYTNTINKTVFLFVFFFFKLMIKSFTSRGQDVHSLAICIIKDPNNAWRQVLQ